MQEPLFHYIFDAREALIDYIVLVRESLFIHVASLAAKRRTTVTCVQRTAQAEQRGTSLRSLADLNARSSIDNTIDVRYCLSLLNPRTLVEVAEHR